MNNYCECVEPLVCSMGVCQSCKLPVDVKRLDKCYCIISFVNVDGVCTKCNKYNQQYLDRLIENEDEHKQT